jgi:hypothetical protein
LREVWSVDFRSLLIERSRSLSIMEELVEIGEYESLAMWSGSIDEEKRLLI